LIARSEETIYHRTASSVLTGCLTFRDKRNSSFRPTVLVEDRKKIPCRATFEEEPEAFANECL
jgi:hypothetical protein